MYKKIAIQELIECADKMNCKYGQAPTQPTSYKLINAVGNIVSDPSQIVAVQKALYLKGVKVRFDGIWGKESHDALIRFQQMNNLPADGKLNKQTVRALELF